jgi:hypothetical protein
MLDIKVNGGMQVGCYKTRVGTQDKTAERHYPVRVYDGNGNLKYEVSGEAIKSHARKKLAAGEHWKTVRSYTQKK